MNRPVAIIVVAQLFGTSLWFSANSAADALAVVWGIGPAEIGTLTNAVQLGFICGTLAFAVSGLADRFAASHIIAVCAVLAAVFNAAFALFATGMSSAVPLRFAVGACLAGVYPLGMKLVVSWVPERAGAALAALLGMLTLGTALPHGVRLVGGNAPWQVPILFASVLSVIAALMILRLGDGPHLPGRGARPRLRLGAVFQAFRIRDFRASACAYFGHMWEVYALWTLAPLLVLFGGMAEPGTPAVSGYAFLAIAIGTAGCLIGGAVSRSVGSARVAATALALSALSCALFPFSPGWPLALQLGLLMLWGASAVADSPHFSALSARACPPDIVGSALAIQNAIGFTISMVSIHFGTLLIANWGPHVAWLLLPGPLIGLVALWPLWRPGAVQR